MDGDHNFATDDDDAELLRGYKALSITNLVLCSTSLFLATTVVIALTLPLFSQRRRKDYSVYNLYLVYLSIPDVIYNAFYVYLLLTRTTILDATNNTNNTNNDFDDDSSDAAAAANAAVPTMLDHASDASIGIACVVSNLYLNVFLTIEMYRLLSNPYHASDRNMRVSNPVLRRNLRPTTVALITKQALASYAIGLVTFVFNHLYGEDLDKTQVFQKLAVMFFECLLVIVIPITVMLGVISRIRTKRLLESTKSLYGGKLNSLTFYFARIVTVYPLIWGPATVFYFLADYQRNPIYYGISVIFTGGQVIVCFFFYLTKPDTYRLVVELLTCKTFDGVGGKTRGCAAAGDDSAARNDTELSGHHGESYLSATSEDFMRDPYFNDDDDDDEGGTGGTTTTTTMTALPGGELDSKDDAPSTELESDEGGGPPRDPEQALFPRDRVAPLKP